MCNNVLELAGNPYNVYTTQELSADTTYIPNYSWITKVNIKLAALIRRYNKIHWFVKYSTAVLLLTFAVYMTIQSGGSTLALFVEFAIGIGFGVSSWAIVSLISQQPLTWEGAYNAVLDAFLFTALLAFISSSINAIKYACRTKPITTPELAKEYVQANRGSTGRTEPQSLNEQLAMEQTMSNPLDGTKVSKINMSDPRWSMNEGWVKMQQHYIFFDESKTTIHYVINERLMLVDDFKFIN